MRREKKKSRNLEHIPLATRTCALMSGPLLDWRTLIGVRLAREWEHTWDSGFTLKNDLDKFFLLFFHHDFKAE
jgi:hypothetical protein